MSDWTDELKVGDLVGVRAYEGWSGRKPVRIAAVVKITKTQITVGADRYRKRGGYKVGGSRWSTESILPLEEAKAWNESLAQEEAEERAGHRAAITAFLTYLDGIPLHHVAEVANKCASSSNAARVARNNALKAFHNDQDSTQSEEALLG